MPGSVDAIVIGSGQGGVPFALELARAGKKVVLFEKDSVGGSCVNSGCTPSKAFLASAHAAGRARKASSLGVHTQVHVDFRQVMERVRSIRSDFVRGLEGHLEHKNMELVRAEAAFTAEGHVKGGGQKYHAPVVVIDTGSSPLIPPVEGLENTPYLTDRNFWDLEDIPRRTLVLGGGYIGLELGQGLARLGSQVRIIEAGARIMGSEIPEVSQVLREALERDGIEFYVKSMVRHVTHDNGLFRAYLGNGTVVEGDAMLVAAGRKPNTAMLNARTAGIELNQKGYVKVDEHFKTSRSGVYAIGEAAGQPAFTHVSWEDYRRLIAILNGDGRTRDDRVLGYATFTDPQLGRAGLTIDEAKKKGYRAGEAALVVKEMARGIEWGEDLGFYRMVVDENTGRILGATLVGYEAGELVHVFMDLIEAGATWKVLERAQHIHPTYAENLPTLARMFSN